MAVLGLAPARLRPLAMRTWSLWCASGASDAPCGHRHAPRGPP